MPVIQIEYDLHAPDKNYDAVEEAIKSYPGWCHVLGSSWLVSGASLTVQGVYDHMSKVFDANDLYLVHPFSKPYAGRLKKDVIKWIDETATY